MASGAADRDRRADLVRKLFTMEDPQFVDLLRRVGSPDGVIRPEAAPLADRIESLFVSAGGPDGCSLDHVRRP